MKSGTWVVALALAASGCDLIFPPPPPDGGGLPPDVCNTLQEALTDPQCTIAQATDRFDWISPPEGNQRDEDWFSFTTPATMDARSLLRVTAGYGAPSTPVQLAVNILSENGMASVGRASDRHGQGPPRPVEILTRFTQPNTRLVLLLTDDPVNITRPQMDPRNQYVVRWDVLQDPDVNEPNDATPTPITLGPQLPEGVGGSNTGYLATPDDDDRFSIAVPVGRKIIYLRVNEASPAPKPSNYRLAYTLYGPPEAGFPGGRPIAEGQVDNNTIPVDLATARLAMNGTGGTYTLSIHAYREPGVVGPLPGDVRLQYRVSVLIVDDRDVNENNDSVLQAQAAAVSLAVGATRPFIGRIGYVGDPDWFAVSLAPDTQPRVLRYRLLPPTGTGRFPPLPTPFSGPDREVLVVTEVTAGATPQERIDNCKVDPVVCPKGYAANPAFQTTVEQFCALSPPQCLHSSREEDPYYQGLRNFEGRLPVPPHASTIIYYLSVQDVGNDWADDRDYTLEVSLLADPDEEPRAALPAQTQVVPFAEDVSGATFPVPPPGASVLSGNLSFGYGRTLENEPTLGQGIRGPADYDAVPTDIDRYELQFPFVDPAAGPLDRTWELQWAVSHVGGSPPHDLALEIEFCDGTQTPTDGGSCYSVTRSRSGGSLVLAYTDEALQGWHNTSNQFAWQPLYERDAGGPATAITARAYGCFCFEPRFVQGGKFFLKVGAVDRNAYDVAGYQVRTAFTAYPKQFAGARDGGMASCPAVTDAGTPDAGAPDAGDPDGGTPPPPPPPRGGCDFTR
jgi:hypothetical protein